MLYGSLGRQADRATLEAYDSALTDRTDYQVTLAIRKTVAEPHEWPVSAGELRRRAGEYAKTPEEEADRYRREKVKAVERIENKEQEPERLSKVRQAMRDECQRIIAEGPPEQAEFCKTLLEKIDNCKGNPLAAIAPTMVKAL